MRCLCKPTKNSLTQPYPPSQRPRTCVATALRTEILGGRPGRVGLGPCAWGVALAPGLMGPETFHRRLPCLNLPLLRNSFLALPPHPRRFVPPTHPLPFLLTGPTPKPHSRPSTGSQAGAAVTDQCMQDWKDPRPGRVANPTAGKNSWSRLFSKKDDANRYHNLIAGVGRGDGSGGAPRRRPRRGPDRRTNCHADRLPRRGPAAE